MSQLAVDSGQVPEGYKQTEVGVIPNDWELSDIESVSLVPTQNGLFFEPKRKGKGIPLINVSDMYSSAPIQIENLDLFDANISEVKTFQAVSGDLFFTRSSVVPTGIAYCNIFLNEEVKAVFDSHLIRVRPNTNLVDSSFLYLNCIFSYARKFLISSAKTAIMTTIDQKAINGCPVLLPPRHEQTAIANAVSDIDTLITSLEKLIAKKRAIKTATMQQLLTGKKRLPEFERHPNGELKGYKQSELGGIPEDWILPKLGDFCTLINGRGFKPHEWESEGLPIIRIQNLNGSEEFNYYSGHYDPKIFVEPNQLLFAWSGSRGTSFGPHIWRGGNALLNYHTWKLVVDHSKVDENFFYHALKALTKQIEDSAHGASALVHTQKGEMEQFYVPLPPTRKEQTAISEALSDIDHTLSLLEYRLAKTQQLKQGMMQELLTGRTRLI
ncbi:restriction endonuclease subunit S [Endozoicomonas ascidiicola]|uniref:restriction endonuclease subunit S n=1 Tax=Endozoicomonas ascidiicola TaxID=1698521 RepID=UPI00082C7A29|nr:restriction endonuclease subunit S [Endozoicomonas ascidiicola]